MKKRIFLIIIICFMCQGCAVLAIGGGIYAVKKIAKRKPKLTELQRRALETKEVEGNREDVLRATVTVFQDRGYLVQSSDYEGGIITASNERPYLQINASIEEFTESRIKMRITMKDKDGVIEDEQVFLKLFDDIQAEVFRRTNLSK